MNTVQWIYLRILFLFLLALLLLYSLYCHVDLETSVTRNYLFLCILSISIISSKTICPETYLKYTTYHSSDYTLIDDDHLKHFCFSSCTYRFEVFDSKLRFSFLPYKSVSHSVNSIRLTSSLIYFRVYLCPLTNFEDIPSIDSSLYQLTRIRNTCKFMFHYKSEAKLVRWSIPSFLSHLISN